MLTRGLSLEEAITQMKLSPKKNARYVLAAMNASKKEAVLKFNWDERCLGISKTSVCPHGVSLEIGLKMEGTEATKSQQYHRGGDV